MTDNAQFAQLIAQIQVLISRQKFEDIIVLIAQQPDALQKRFEVQKITAIILMKLRRYGEAKDILHTVLETHPEQHDIRHNLALACNNLGDITTAIEHAKTAIEQGPAVAKYYVHLADLYKQNLQLKQAVLTLRLARLKGVNDQTLNSELAALLNTIFEYQDALDVLEETGTNFYSLLLSLEARIQLNHYDKAMALVPQMIKHLDVSDPNLVIAFSEMLNQLGEFSQAQEILSGLNQNLSFETAHTKLQSGAVSESEITQLVNSTGKMNLDTEQQSKLDYAISKQYFKLKDQNRAFEYCHRANANNLPDENYKADVAGAFDVIKSTYRDFSSSIEGSESQLPVFIIGMPRSGTTLLENIIATHSQAFGAGETPYLNLALNDMDYYASTHSERLAYLAEMTNWTTDHYQHMSAYYLERLKTYDPNARRIVDKLPHNFLHLGAIRHLFPKAHIIHIKRNPIATCLSIYKENMGEFHLYGNDLAYLPEYYNRYQDLMAFWKEHLDLSNFKEVNYEDLIQDSEQQVRSILDFIGLDYEPECLDFHKVKRTVKTLSKEQVRNAIYTSSLTPWVGVEDEIKPLIEGFMP